MVAFDDEHLAFEGETDDVELVHLYWPNCRSRRRMHVEADRRDF